MSEKRTALPQGPQHRCGCTYSQEEYDRKMTQPGPFGLHLCPLHEAAPDLLEALKEVVVHLTDCSLRGHFDSTEYESIRDLIGACAGIIAKAETVGVTT